MDPRDVNRINYNNYFVGQNLDFLVRSKMRSESLSTPLKNTPAFYDDQVTSKMSLLGKRGFYDPGYIYGFNNPEDHDINDLQKNKNNEYTNPITREQYDQIILPKEHYREQMEQNYEMNNKINNINPNNKNYNNNMNEEMYYKERNKQIERDRERERMEMMRERQTPQKLDNFQLDRINKNQTNYENYENPNYINRNIINNNNNINQQEIRNEYKPNYHYDPFYPKENMRIYDKYKSGMERNKDKIPNLNYAQQINDYNSINDIDKKNVGDLVLPPTKNEILQEVYLENFNKKHSPK